jgi:hypothetical protein
VLCPAGSESFSLYQVTKKKTHLAVAAVAGAWTPRARGAREGRVRVCFGGELRSLADSELQKKIHSKVVAMSAGWTPMHKKGTPRWWTRELREREATIRNTKQEYYAYRSDIHAEYVIAT